MTRVFQQVSLRWRECFNRLVLPEAAWRVRFNRWVLHDESVSTGESYLRQHDESVSARQQVSPCMTVSQHNWLWRHHRRWLLQLCTAVASGNSHVVRWQTRGMRERLGDVKRTDQRGVNVGSDQVWQRSAADRTVGCRSCHTEPVDIRWWINAAAHRRQSLLRDTYISLPPYTVHVNFNKAINWNVIILLMK